MSRVRKTRMTQITSDPCHPRKSVTEKLQKNSEYSSRLGEPVPALVTWFVVEPLTIALRVVVAEAAGGWWWGCPPEGEGLRRAGGRSSERVSVAFASGDGDRNSGVCEIVH